MRFRPATALTAAAVVAACGCASAKAPDHTAGRQPATGPPSATLSPDGTTQSAPATATDWPVYHVNAARTGSVSGLPRAGSLGIAWTRKLDGAVYGQPLVVGGLVVAATENDSVYGLDRASGEIRWRRHVGTPVPLSALPCGDIDPLGITGTPAYDPRTRLVYAVAEQAGFRHVLYGFSLSGQVKVRRDLPAPDGHPRYDQQRPALAITAGRVYVAFGGLFGDCGPYIGSVVGVPLSGHGALISYRVPTTREGAIWGTGGPTLGPHGALYVSVGNGAAARGRYDGSDSVLALSSGLRRTGFFAPRSWAADNANDLDLGSMSPAVLADGSVVADGKRGTAYLLNGAHLGGIGGQRAQAAVCAAFGGPSVRGTVAYIPCAEGGMAAVDTAGGRLRVLWRGPPGAAGSPVLGGGAVWVPGIDSGTLYELDPSTGRVRHQIGLGSALPHFASPSLSGDLVFTGTLNGITAVRGA
jgi:polyvinyl alcohol dehydrogenase (cytochrome)